MGGTGARPAACGSLRQLQRPRMVQPCIQACTACNAHRGGCWS